MNLKRFNWIVLVGTAFVVLLISLLVVKRAGATTEACFCHNVNNNPHTVCTSNSGHIAGHTTHVNNGNDTFGACVPVATTTPTNSPIPSDSPTASPSATPVESLQPTPTSEDTPVVTLQPTASATPTDEPRVTPNPTDQPKGGSGVSDGKGCAEHPCYDGHNTQPGISAYDGSPVGEK